MSPTLLARRARVARIRRTITAATVAVFIALFATIYIQMAAGKDPALGTTVTAALTTGTSVVRRVDLVDDDNLVRGLHVDDLFRRRLLFGVGHDHLAVVSSGG